MVEKKLNKYMDITFQECPVCGIHFLVIRSRRTDNKRSKLWTQEKKDLKESTQRKKRKE